LLSEGKIVLAGTQGQSSWNRGNEKVRAFLGAPTSKTRLFLRESAMDLALQQEVTVGALRSPP